MHLVLFFFLFYRANETRLQSTDIIGNPVKVAPLSSCCQRHEENPVISTKREHIISIAILCGTGVNGCSFG